MMRGMKSNIPSPQQVRDKLAPMSQATLLSIAERSGVPVTTIIKIRNGQTPNPRIDTVRAIWPELVDDDHPAPQQDSQEVANA